MSSYVVGKDMQALVADVGSYSTKIGYAGDDHPQAVYNSTTAVERIKRAGSGSGAVSSNFVSGPKRDFASRCVSGAENDGGYELVNPIDHVTGWPFSPPSRQSLGGHSLSSNDENAMDVDGSSGIDDRFVDAWESHELFSRYLEHAFNHALGMNGANSLDRSMHHPLLLLDKPHTPPALRQRLLEILFETHNLPATFFLRDAIASCYAVGRTTATVVDVGYSSTMVSPVYEGFVEGRGVLRNNACSARCTEERVLEMMDGIVKKQGGRRRKDRLRRLNQRRLEREANEKQSGGGANANSSAEGGGSGGGGESPPKRSSVKRDDKGHFIKESATIAQSLAPIPDYLMPLYQVKRAPGYAARSGPFHDWSRMALAREIKEMGLGVAVGPMGYVPTHVSAAASAAAAAAEGGEGAAPAESSAINPAAANNVFLTSSKLPYTLPDGTHVEISTASRCDVVELFFGNDEETILYREKVFDDAVAKLEEYEAEIEDFIASKDEDEDEDSAKKRGIASSAPAGDAGDPYSSTSYRGEKTSRHVVGRNSKVRTYYSPSTISTKLYSACLPYVRTSPPASAAEGLGGDGGADANVNDDNYFHYLTSAPPAQMVCDAAFRCDRDQQASLLGNVVVCGGGACITGAAGVGAAGPLGAGAAAAAAGTAAGGAGGAGLTASALGDEHAFPDRLREEIEAIVHRHTPGWRVKVTSPNITERAICSWLGGSILGSLGTFQDMWISRKDYEEFGSAIVNRKCP